MAENQGDSRRRNEAQRDGESRGKGPEARMQASEDRKRGGGVVGKPRPLHPDALDVVPDWQPRD
jgi:hypothetical protein